MCMNLKKNNRQEKKVQQVYSKKNEAPSSLRTYKKNNFINNCVHNSLTKFEKEKK